MPRLIDIPTFTDDRGSLCVLDDLLPFPVRRVYYIHAVASGASRGGHRHRRNRQVLIALTGFCRVVLGENAGNGSIVLDSPRHGLLLESADWHRLEDFRPGTVVLVLASEPYDPSDYLDATQR